MDRPRALLAKYYVEDVPVGDHDRSDIFDWTNTPFYDTLTQRVRAYFKETNQSHKTTWRKALWLLLNTLVCIYAVAYGLMQG
jgi:hypothetical protein